MGTRCEDKKMLITTNTAINAVTVKCKIKKMENVSYVGSEYSGYCEIKE